MRVFLTGGAGYIGSVCVEELLNAGHSVTVFDDLCEGHRSAVDERAMFVPGDLSNRVAVYHALKESNAEGVVHFAAAALVGESMTNPGKYFGTNVAGGLNLLDAAVNLRIKRFVFSSTCAVYGPPESVPMTEDLPFRPINPYGESKRMFERLLSWYGTIHGLEFIAFRYFNAAGASERFGEHHRVETHLIPNVLRVALGQSESCAVFGTDYPTPDGTCVRDYVHVSDLAQAHMLALTSEKSGFYNLGSGVGFSVREVIKVCEKITGSQISAIEKPRRPGDPPRLVASAEKAIRELNWKPNFPEIEAIISTAWKWHKQNPTGYVD
ncbi:MAG: UDP-glucose 4-epimerase GalE [Verrucomicrobia bacterium]|nr:UDP-glucose 4-epimerase GalE [Verrucomicrobiota bacterium]